MSRLYCCLFLSVALIPIMLSTALATTYIDVEASSIDEYAVNTVYDADGITDISVRGTFDFEVEVTESYPANIDTCWIYIDGSTTTGTTRQLSVDDYRLYVCGVVIKYSDSTYESYKFYLHGCWPVNDPPSTNAQPPSTYSIPSDSTAATLMQTIINEDLQSSGPTAVEYFCVCNIADQACENMVDVAHSAQCPKSIENCIGFCDS